MATQLYTFTISHFGERAKWALDHKGVDYQTRILLPGPHLLMVRRLAKATSVPVFRHGDKVVQGSRAIVDYVDDMFDGPPLRADDQSAMRRLEKMAESGLGYAVRRCIYAELCRYQPEDVKRMWKQDGPWYGRAVYAVAFGICLRGLARMYDFRRHKVEASRVKLAETLDRLDAIIDGREFYVGGRFSRVDITMASLLAPLTRPANHGCRWPDPMPANVRALEDAHRDRPSFQHALRMYAEHRHQSGAT